MTLVDCPPFFYPGIYDTSSQASLTLGEAGDAAGAVFQFPKDGTLTHWIFTTDSSTVTSGTASFYLSQVLSTGLPSTTIYAANASGSISVSAASTIYECPINSGTGVTVNAGDYAAGMIYVATAGTLRCGIINNADHGTSSNERGRFPYPIGDTAGGTTDPTTSNGMSKGPDSRTAVCGLRYSGSDYVPVGPCSIGNVASGNHFWSSGSTDDERGIRFQVPFKCRVIGVWWHANPDNGATGVWRLVNSSGVEQAVTNSLDEDQAGSVTDHWETAYFTDPFEVAADTEYYVLHHATSANNRRLYYDEFQSNSFMPLSLSRSAQIHYAHRDNSVPATITDVNDTYIYAGVIIDQLDDGASAGGGGTTVTQGLHAISSGINA